ncbi:hemagglutinin repeat-containing protein [Variovorax sp. PAMC28562]|uniref:hemagglutinin repeat-containing protein n=1 Tax=Variovorax sp. PAMC28562 TaxID=2762323 RepID=UPI0021C42080|nr:hemagglutinin repeat-containing protein [Variovorax sp. PAMC28562]
MKITATGGGADSNLTATATATGATLSGSNVTLDADNAVTLQAAQNTTTQTGSSSGSKQTLGASYSVGEQNGFAHDVGASQSRAVLALTADTVKADVGGTLNVYNPMTPPSFLVIITVAERGRATAPPGP